MPILLSLAMLLALAQGPAVPVASLAGTYALTGTGPNGPYQGSAVIVQKDHALVVQWSSNEGQLAGFGVVQGQQAAVGYALRNGWGAAVLYQLSDGVLRGQWADPTGTVYAETLTRQAEERVSQ